MKPFSIIDNALPPASFHALSRLSENCDDDEADIAGFPGSDLLFRLAGHDAETPHSALVVKTLRSHSHSVHQDRGFDMAILHLNREWHLNWGGELLLVADDHETIVKAVEFRPNRLVTFPGEHFHVVRPSTSKPKEPRRALVLRFRHG